LGDAVEEKIMLNWEECLEGDCRGVTSSLEKQLMVKKMWHFFK
jgi:hypothetical protein